MATMTREYAYACPSCESPQPPIPESRVTPAGWITFLVLLVLGIAGAFLFCPLGLLAPIALIGLSLRQYYGRCPACGHET